MRPRLSELIDININALKDQPHHEASITIINALKEAKDNLSQKLLSADYTKGYEELSEINYTIMYLDKAINSRQQDYEELIS